MPQQNSTFAENNFTKGLITDSTGLNFPEDAATDTDNCVFTITGDVTRRLGIDKEVNGLLANQTVAGKAVASYLWNNAGGDGSSKLFALQVGKIVSFYLVTAATVASPLSNHLIGSVDVSFWAVSSFDETLECEFADGNGYLFIFNQNSYPVYVTYAGGVVTGNGIDVKIRDFTGVPESTDVNFRPSTLSNSHQYNLINQGWITGNPWSMDTATTYDNSSGSHAFTVPAGVTGVVGGSLVKLVYQGVDATFFGQTSGPLTAGTAFGIGTVSSYVGTTITINITTPNVNFPSPLLGGASAAPFTIVPIGSGYINAWFAAIGNYPSNADVWWYFKNGSGVFDPTVSANTSLASGNAPQGHFILSAFNQQKTTVSGIATTNIVTTKRPSVGAWFQGRVWYAGLDDTQAAVGNAPFYTWTENIYFSQVVTGTNDFANCYQVNDPTSEQLFDLLPTDGGVITIQGSGKVYKLFPIQNGMLVFAANGVWFITGSQGIGFSANDYTITRISTVRSISSTSFVSVNGLPFFWNEEAIYAVTPSQQGQLTVEPLTVGTIGTFYEEIPTSSKRYVRGDYDPIEYRIQWVYNSTKEVDVDTRYRFNRMLNYNTYNKAFYPYTLADGSFIRNIRYVYSPGNINAPDPVFKYFFERSTICCFADEHDETFTDLSIFNGNTPNFTSFFVTGYKLRGQAIKKFQPTYIQMYSRMGDSDGGYKIQGLWNFSINRNSGQWSTIQSISIPLDSNYTTVFKRHKIRGHGFALQFKVTSQDGKPFDIVGWAVVDGVNAGT